MSMTNGWQAPNYEAGPNIEALDEWIVGMENLTSEGSAGSVNIPWLLSISVSMGNAATEAIGKNAVIFCEPEWGLDITGGSSGRGGGSGQGSASAVGW